MVAYSFKPRFIKPIQAMLKKQTIRSPRARHARPGEDVQIYHGMRTRYCFKIIPDPVCISVAPVCIRRGFLNAPIIILDGVVLGLDEMQVFALADGFSSMEDMMQFWRDNHGLAPFEGVCIRWK